MAKDLDEFVFVGLNSRVAALDRATGETLWQWKSPRGRGYVSLLLLGEKDLIVSVNGYTYCLDPRTGREQWFNELPGFGSDVASIAALNSHTPHTPLAAAAADASAAASSSGG